MANYSAKPKKKRILTAAIIALLLIVLFCIVLLALKDRGADSSGSTVILACSDIQKPSNSNLYSNGNYRPQKAILKSIMKRIRGTYPHVSGFFCGGDYNFDVTRAGNSYKKNGAEAVYSSAEAAAATARGADILFNTVSSVFPAVNDENAFFIQGNHDTFCGRLDETGGTDMGAYAVYVINEKDYPAESALPEASAFSSSEELCAHTAAELSAWLDGLVGQQKPVFILSHVPLHYSARLLRSGDAVYAQYLYDAIESHGDKLNVFFLYGHDHAHGDDDYLCGSAQFLTRGDPLTVARAGDTDISRALRMTLNFTYMNYGFAGYYWDSWDPKGGPVNENTDCALTMTTFEISGSEVTVRRWDKKGEHVLKAAGAESLGLVSAPDPISPDTKIYGSPQTVGQ